MILEIVTSFLFGFILVSLLDFLLFIGLKINYFNTYNIGEYFNVIFVDNQNVWLIVALSFLFGYLMLYSKLSKFFDTFYIILLILFASTLYEPIGKRVGEEIFREKNKIFEVSGTKFRGDLLYEGRSYYYIKRDEIKSAIRLSKEDVKIVK
ncbi:MAG: isoleucyl-tRNA synthetase [Epsilonproteobacteria bacterium]|nr:isoleucyl-tRNA synthetase [Campylobacterota bacterium]